MKRQFGGCTGLNILILLFATVVIEAAPPEEADRFGVKKFWPTANDGREWFADWQKPRTVKRFQFDPQDSLLKNSDGTLEIKDGIARLPSVRSRLFVMTPKDKSGRYTAPLWRNVEMTAYVRCGQPTQKVSGQALSLTARSGERHSDDVPCEGTSYHSSLRFDGQCGFKKEIWHTGGYTDLRPDPAPRPWPTVPAGRWIGMKFVCRNANSNRHVRLQLYIDPDNKNEWQLLSDITDQGGWQGNEPGCNRARDYIITEGRPAVYFRTDYVPIEIKSFSVREIDPLP